MPRIILTRISAPKVFKAHTKGGGSTKVAGCRIIDGEVKQGISFRVMRNGEELYTVPSAESLRHFKQKVSTVAKGQVSVPLRTHVMMSTSPIFEDLALPYFPFTYVKTGVWNWPLWV